MEKVKISKEVADAIRLWLLNHEESSKAEFIRVFTYDKGEWWEEYKALNKIDLDTLIRALYIGYEVDLTPGDRLLKLYNKVGKEYDDEYDKEDSDCEKLRCLSSYRIGIRDSVNILGIKIVGIND